MYIMNEVVHGLGGGVKHCAIIVRFNPPALQEILIHASDILALSFASTRLMDPSTF